MGYYVRKIARAKWTSVVDDKEGTFDREIQNYRADALANDLKTSNDTLSFWWTDSLSEDDLEPVVLINSLLGDTISKIELICVPDEMITGYLFEQTDGDTVVTQYKNLHYNMVKLSVKMLLKFAQDVILTILARKYEDDEELLVKRISKTEQLQLLKKWIQSGQLCFDDLNEKQKAALNKVLDR